MKLPTTTQLYDLVNTWKARLNLPLWRVRIFYEPDLPPSVRGRCYWEGSLNDATILINPAIDWSAYPIEKTVLHEVLHLKFAQLGDPCPECIEEAVIDLTTSLFDAYRR